MMAKPDYKELYELTLAERRQINERLAHALRYDAELNRLEIAPNGDDYNALTEMLAGGRFRAPHTEGR